jgi:Na+-translocating ferredoxin:NAD+ oxidoreductase RnfG subunit
VRECEGVNIHTPEETPTLGDGILVDFQNFREKFQGQNSMAYDVFFISLESSWNVDV